MDMDVQNFFMGKDAPEKPSLGVVRQVLAHAPDLMVCRVRFARCGGSVCIAIRACTDHIHSPRCVFELIGGRKVVLRAGGQHLQAA